MGILGLVGWVSESDMVVGLYELF